jgi:processive 1,2-diacylglycerol beta-glucosyltransferase
MAQKKFLMLSASAGAGHVRAADAVCAQAASANLDVVTAHLDVMSAMTAGFRKLYTEFYLTLVNKAPALWSYLYQSSNDAEPDSTMQRLRRGVERLNSRSLIKQIEAYQADAIVCTHFLPAELLSRAIRLHGFRCPVWVQVTDFDLHRMWVHPHMAGYFAANEEVAFRMRARDYRRHDSRDRHSDHARIRASAGPQRMRAPIRPRSTRRFLARRNATPISCLNKAPPSRHATG